jgi:hypothetical protein
VIKGMGVADKMCQADQGPLDIPKGKVIMTRVCEKTE